LEISTMLWYQILMKRKHKHTLDSIFSHPASGNIRWTDIVSLLRELGAEIKERGGSRVEVFLFGQVRVFHRPHRGLDTDKGAVAAIRRWLERHGVKP
ncbi:MAG TPA: type II toxin-antitoxin system HicA family toxin, partial [Syntrophobacteraceae bacterium]|nr:type II toxin-antitoxin system HicA family toxin [Syntrophobacteraceae bacterium]